MGILKYLNIEILKLYFRDFEVGNPSKKGTAFTFSGVKRRSGIVQVFTNKSRFPF